MQYGSVCSGVLRIVYQKDAVCVCVCVCVVSIVLLVEDMSVSNQSEVEIML